MRHATLVVVRLALVGTFAVTAAAQKPLPKEPFKAVHLVNITSPADVAALQATIDDLNAVVTKAGMGETRYRLYKVAGKRAGTYNYLLESSWPGGDVYDRIHKSAEWTGAAMKHPEFARITKDEVYNRYVEVQSKSR
jgi:hypothetical protein